MLQVRMDVEGNLLQIIVKFSRYVTDRTKSRDAIINPFVCQSQIEFFVDRLGGDLQGGIEEDEPQGRRAFLRFLQAVSDAEGPGARPEDEEGNIGAQSSANAHQFVGGKTEGEDVIYGHEGRGGI